MENKYASGIKWNVSGNQIIYNSLYCHSPHHTKSSKTEKQKKQNRMVWWVAPQGILSYLTSGNGSFYSGVVLCGAYEILISESVMTRSYQFKIIQQIVNCIVVKHYIISNVSSVYVNDLIF